MAEHFNDDIMQEEEVQAPQSESNALWTFMLVVAMAAQVVAMVLSWKELSDLFRAS